MTRPSQSPERFCRINFCGLAPHQVRYLLQTFTGPCIEYEFLVSAGTVLRGRRLFGLRGRSSRQYLNGPPGTNAWRTPDRRTGCALHTLVQV